ncbi:hypothetical protein [Sphingobium chungbukense]|uniref:Uncharacterized protein n=1 Tax=Sphingobium chungbukense TaxID=56193 RepID=A0A0M3AJN2_9SPHN|nr:hypothetical protein [Sphingobium chungbukense]KKW90178.1 hypothetical protein YP76_22375 [Sphingobium chungbukense]
MAKFEGRELLLMKKALSLAILVIERQPDGPFKPESDLVDMKDLAEQLMADDTELEHYLSAAQRILTGKP